MPYFLHVFHFKKIKYIILIALPPILIMVKQETILDSNLFLAGTYLVIL